MRMNFMTAAVAATLAIAPSLAGAVTINSDRFSLAPAVNLIDNSGFQGAVNIETDDGDLAFDQSWIFEAVEPLFATGSATILNSKFVANLDLIYNGGTVLPMMLDPEATTVSFPTLRLASGEQFEVRVSFDSASAGGDIDFDIETSVIPVPAAGVLMLSGLAGLGFLSRRRKSTV